MSTVKKNNTLRIGFTMLPHDYNTAIAKLHLTGNQYAVLMALIRYTWGLQLITGRVGYQYIREFTALSNSTITDAITALAEKKLLHLSRGRNGHPTYYTVMSPFSRVAGCCLQHDQHQDEAATALRGKTDGTVLRGKTDGTVLRGKTDALIREEYITKKEPLFCPASETAPKPKKPNHKAGLCVTCIGDDLPLTLEEMQADIQRLFPTR